MSETEAYTGKLTPIDRDGKTVEEWIQETLNMSSKPEHESWIGWYSEQRYNHPDREYPEILYSPETDILYLIEKTKMDTNGFTVSEKHDDGSASFTVLYYNGGTDLNEVLSGIL